MTLVNVGLWVAGIALIIIGYARAKVPWSRYQALRGPNANAARAQAWRGGVRNVDRATTGASVAMQILRRQAQIGGAIALAGFVLVFLGFLIK